MATKNTSSAKRKATMAPLTTKTLRRVAEAATKAASKAAFDVVETLLVVQDGWLVRVDKTGTVVEQVKRIELPVI